LGGIGAGSRIGLSIGEPDWLPVYLPPKRESGRVILFLLLFPCNEALPKSPVLGNIQKRKNMQRIKAVEKGGQERNS
jgi:hypothetical protein